MYKRDVTDQLSSFDIHNISFKKHHTVSHIGHELKKSRKFHEVETVN